MGFSVYCIKKGYRSHFFRIPDLEISTSIAELTPLWFHKQADEQKFESSYRFKYREKDIIENLTNNKKINFA